MNTKEKIPIPFMLVPPFSEKVDLKHQIESARMVEIHIFMNVPETHSQLNSIILPSMCGNPGYGPTCNSTTFSACMDTPNIL
jgi:hypothetical protein